MIQQTLEVVGYGTCGALAASIATRVFLSIVGSIFDSWDDFL